MKRKENFFKYEVISTIIILILGIILHFSFEWSDNNPIVGTFSAVNESTWEHLKLIFFPMLLISIIGYYYFKKEYPNYLCIKIKAIVIAITFIIIFFYTSSGVIGKNIDILNIASFFIAVILSQYYAYKKIKSNYFCNNKIANFIIILLLLCFIIFTFYTPTIGLFKDPVTGKFGI